MTTLHQLNNSTRIGKKTKRLGRGTGSRQGKTCGRGHKGQGARSGYRRRYGKEGGQLPLYRKLPTRGFNNARFQNEWIAVNLDQIEQMYQDGETVNAETLKDHGFFTGQIDGIKILGNGTLTKKVTIEVDAISEGAKQKLTQAKIAFTIKE